MNSSSLFSHINYLYKNEEYVMMKRLVTFLLCSLGATLFASLLTLSSPKPFKLPTNQQTHILTPKPQQDDKECDLFKGRWIPDPNGSGYTSTNCDYISEAKNCFKNGRKDTDFVKLRWKPNECELPRFDPETFLRIVQNKRMAFVGDSVSHNQMESLLCLLSQVVIPTELDVGNHDRIQSMYFNSHNFTLAFIRSLFLVENEPRRINGSLSRSIDLYLDKVDTRWSENLVGFDYAIISDSHWFLGTNYLYEGGKLIGCVECTEADIPHFGYPFAIGKAFGTAIGYISGCKECEGMMTVIRTFSPSHFEGGKWNAGGYCNKTSHRGEDEIDWGGYDWELRTVQVEQVERVRKGGGARSGQRFVELDVTMAMLMRPDGHPGSYGKDERSTGGDDCVHWCLPGPVDVWNDLLMALLKRDAGLPVEG